MDNISSYSSVIDSLIARQMSILGPDITLAKVRKVPEIQLDTSGKVVDINGNPQDALNKLIGQFVELSGLIVRKTLESIVASQSQANQATAAQVMQQAHQTTQAPASQTSNKEVIQVLNQALSDINFKTP